MQPQAPTAPVSSPSPNPQYDFILRDPQQPKRRFGLPGMSGLPKPMIVLVALAGLLLVSIIYAVIFGGSKTSNSQQLVAVAGRAQEIARISTLVQQQSLDPNTQYLAATAQTALSSEQYQLTSYLGKHGAKVSTAQLLVYKNASTDTQLQTAKQNNALESSYASYLKTSLATYQTALKAATAGTSKTTLAILNDASTSTQVILAAPQLK